MEYSVSVNQNNIVIESKTTNTVVDVTAPAHEISLSRTGGQGAKGDGVTDAYITQDNHLVLVISNSAGDVIEEVDVGDLSASLFFDLNDLTDVTINLTGAGYVLAYNNTTNKWTSRKLATTDLSDVAITAIGENHILAYDNVAKKFKNHKLTTARLSNVDETALTDGALLVYNGTTAKYVATTQIENNNTTIIGGSF